MSKIFQETIIKHVKLRGIISTTFLLALSFITFSTINQAAQDTTNATATDNLAEVRFLNTQSNSTLTTSYTSNEAVIVKTYDGKYVLIDTGNRDSDIRAIIYNELKKYQNTNNVTIDYLIISHLDPDHYGNARDILDVNNSNFTVKNVIIKHENWMWVDNSLGPDWEGISSTKKWYYKDIIVKALQKGAHIYTNASGVNDPELTSFWSDGALANNYTALTEGKEINVGNYLTLSIFNTAEAYQNFNCTENSTGKIVAYYAYTSQASIEADSTAFRTSDNKFVYFDSNDYPNITLKTTDTLIQETDQPNNKFKYRYYYAYVGNNTNTCRSNADSLAVLMEAKNSKTSKYMYFPGDLDNNGYTIIPENGIYGNGYTYIYNSDNLSFSDGSFNTPAQSAKAPQETLASQSIYNKLGSKVKDIVIYQEAHHGYNVAPDAINLLQINRSSNPPYAISTGNYKHEYSSGKYISYDAEDTRWFDGARTYYYALSNLPSQNKLSSSRDNDGVSCYINVSGQYGCYYASESTNVFTLSYNGNNGTNIPSNQTCETIGSNCTTIISSNTPTRAGYTFLGWADSASATSAQYQAGASITLSANKTIYAVWQQNSATHTLSYNVNNGTGAPASQSCTAPGTNTSCTVTVSSTAPTRAGYTFLGWADSTSSTSAQYQAGSSITLSSNKTIYAIWEKIPDEPDQPGGDEPDQPGGDEPSGDEPSEEPSDEPNGNEPSKTKPSTKTPDTGNYTGQNSNADSNVKNTVFIITTIITVTTTLALTTRLIHRRKSTKF